MITKYDPMNAPDGEEWLALDEDEKIELVWEYHLQTNPEAAVDLLHSFVHVVVETYAANGDKYPVKKVLDRIMYQGLNRHEAIHAIGGKLIKTIWQIGRGRNASEAFKEISRFKAPDWQN